LKIGVIGFGSIGRRHCENFISLGYSDITLLRSQSKSNIFGLNEIYVDDEFLAVPFDFIILSTPTSLHFPYLKKLILMQQNIFVEKPIVSNNEEAKSLQKLLTNYHGLGMCGYNLRFHPCVKKVYELLSSNNMGQIYSARFFVGQYLPDWRPYSDYRVSYSAKSDLGGGVVLDLIHEIDLASFLFGKVKKSFHAMVGKLSALEIETEDIAEIHYQAENDTLVSIHLDYLTRGYSRYFEVICENGRIHCDLYTAEIKVIRNKNIVTDVFTFKEFNRNDMYLSLIRYFTDCIETKTQPQPNLFDGMESLNTALTAKSFWKNNEK
jgi:predicted dehydrogenase